MYRLLSSYQRYHAPWCTLYAPDPRSSFPLFLRSSSVQAFVLFSPTDPKLLPLTFNPKLSYAMTSNPTQEIHPVSTAVDKDDLKIPVRNASSLDPAIANWHSARAY
jgi:hypothetical protein